MIKKLLWLIKLLIRYYRKRMMLRGLAWVTLGATRRWSDKALLSYKSEEKKLVMYTWLLNLGCMENLGIECLPFCVFAKVGCLVTK